MSVFSMSAATKSPFQNLKQTTRIVRVGINMMMKFNHQLLQSPDSGSINMTLFLKEIKIKAKEPCVLYLKFTQIGPLGPSYDSSCKRPTAEWDEENMYGFSPLVTNLFYFRCIIND